MFLFLYIYLCRNVKPGRISWWKCIFWLHWFLLWFTA